MNTQHRAKTKQDQQVGYLVPSFFPNAFSFFLFVLFIFSFYCSKWSGVLACILSFSLACSMRLALLLCVLSSHYTVISTTHTHTHPTTSDDRQKKVHPVSVRILHPRDRYTNSVVRLQRVRQSKPKTTAINQAR